MEIVNRNHDQNSKQKVDSESEASMAHMNQSKGILSQQLENIRLVLVVLSSQGIVFDIESLRQKILLTYPDAAVFFQGSIGKFIGPASPEKVDLVIDFTGPGQRQNLFYAKKLKKMARFTVGRNAGIYRKKLYDRIFDEKAEADQVPQEMLAKERYVQKKVLNLAGVFFVQAGETLPDRGKSIALELPPMKRL